MTSIIIDLDPQGTACNWKDRRKSDGPVVIDAQPGRLAAALAKAEENGVALPLSTRPRATSIRPCRRQIRRSCADPAPPAGQ